MFQIRRELKLSVLCGLVVADERADTESDRNLMYSYEMWPSDLPHLPDAS